MMRIRIRINCDAKTKKPTKPSTIALLSHNPLLGKYLFAPFMSGKMFDDWSLLIAE